MEFIMWVVYGFASIWTLAIYFIRTDVILFRLWGFALPCVRSPGSAVEFHRFKLEHVYRRNSGRIVVMKMKFSCSTLWRLMIGNLNSCGHGAINWLFTFPYGCISRSAVGNSANHLHRLTCHGSFSSLNSHWHFCWRKPFQLSDHRMGRN